MRGGRCPHRTTCSGTSTRCRCTAPGSRKARLIEKAGRFALCAQVADVEDTVEHLRLQTTDVTSNRTFRRYPQVLIFMKGAFVHLKWTKAPFIKIK